MRLERPQARTAVGPAWAPRHSRGAARLPPPLGRRPRRTICVPRRAAPAACLPRTGPPHAREITVDRPHPPLSPQTNEASGRRNEHVRLGDPARRAAAVALPLLPGHAAHPTPAHRAPASRPAAAARLSRLERIDG
eukprot:2782933-Prymnesium_polylepis.2